MFYLCATIYTEQGRPDSCVELMSLVFMRGNELNQKLNTRHFADDILKRLSINLNHYISAHISLKFVREVKINKHQHM